MENQEQQAAAPPAQPPAPASAVEEELVELKILKPMAGTDFSWRPNSVQSVPKSRALRLIKTGLAKLADEADKAAQAVRVQTETQRVDFQKRAAQAESKCRQAEEAAQAADLEARKLKAALEQNSVRVEELERDQRVLIERTQGQEAEIRRQNVAAEARRDQIEEAEAAAKAAQQAQEAAQANLDETRAALKTAEEARDMLQGKVDKLQEEVADRDRTIAQLQKKAATSAKKPR